MNILENVLMSEHTTFHIGGPARFFGVVVTISDLLEGIAFAEEHALPILFLSGGSNMLVSDSGFSGFVLKLDLKGIEKVLETGEEVVVKVASGEVWDEVVTYAVNQGLWGIENLSHIPGRMGGVPVQNVGAYGQEAKNVIVSVDAYDLKEKKLVTLENKDCNFSYRRSIFNTTKRGRYAILYTRIVLSKLPRPNLDYRDLRLRFNEGTTPSPSEIRNAVISIRDKKFPFPVSPETGNSGSWFKNVTLDSVSLNKLKGRLQTEFGSGISARLEEYEKNLTTEAGTKIPAAFLLDACGLKGLSMGGAVINPEQPLVIVNKSGTARATDVLGIVKKVRTTVLERMGIALEIEPELVGFSAEEIREHVAIPDVV